MTSSPNSLSRLNKKTVLDVDEEHVVDEVDHFLENQDAHEQEYPQAEQAQVVDWAVKSPAFWKKIGTIC